MLNKEVGCVIINYRDAAGVINILSTNEECFSKIVVVDNFSNDDSLEKIKEYIKNNQMTKVTLIESKKNIGFSKGNNLGIKYLIEKLNMDYIVCINTDILISNNTINRCVNILNKRKNIGLISTKMKEYDGKEGISAWHFPKFSHLLKMCFWLYRKNNNYNIPYEYVDDGIYYVDVIRGSFMVFRAKCLKEIDYFDPNTFLYYEENIIGKKMKEKGFASAIITDEFYIHNHPKKNNTIVNMKIFEENLASTAYYLYNYQKISKLSFFIFKICSYYSIFEQFLINKIKKVLIRRK